MRTLYTASHADVSAQWRAFIERFGQAHDGSCRDLVAAHFTIVFGIRALSDAQYAEPVCKVTSSLAMCPSCAAVQCRAQTINTGFA